ncbi:CMRF35-like molecule 1 isoform X6 [Salmo trutta]|uniref:CMRF35-like molecule 1 isoform X6 n=1 Tax=Salmo trutta TaxID=8032 RepID=UPI00112FDD0D|nr:CMRF35-like molecule 1 isoform X6 [Salmo trutta]
MEAGVFVLFVMRLLVCPTAAVWSVCSAELITVEGYKGGKAEIRCPYKEEWRSHQKYLCKGDCPVYYKDKVIKTEEGGNSASKGRYSLKDNREESVFIVTITNLTLKDAGSYWCGVDKWGQDNYIKVNLEVSEVVIIVSGILVMLLLVLVVSLLIVYRWKLNQETADCSAPRVNTGINIEGCHGDGDYEEIKDRLLQSSSGGETTTIYSPANLPTSPSDCLNYASVNFHKDPSCPNEATAAITKEGTFSGDYATVNVSQNPAYSTVNHPHSSSESPPIYSTVSKSRDT